MAQIDKRNTVEHLNTGGSRIGLAVYLPAPVALDIYGAGSAAGWYVPWTLEGGKISHVVESELDEDEAGELTGAVIVSSEKAMLENVIKETSDEAEDLIDKYLSKGFYKYRYLLPVKTAGQVRVYGFQNAIVEPGWEVAVGKGKRTRPIKITATCKDDVPAYVRRTVDNDQDAWDGDLVPFKDVP